MKRVLARLPGPTKFTDAENQRHSLDEGLVGAHHAVEPPEVVVAAGAGVGLFLIGDGRLGFGPGPRRWWRLGLWWCVKR